MKFYPDPTKLLVNLVGQKFIKSTSTFIAEVCWDKEWPTMPCKKCGLQYSSYCVNCIYVRTGLNLNDEEYHEILKLRSDKNAN